MSTEGSKYAPRPGHIPGVAVNLGGHMLVLAPLGLALVRHFDERGAEMRKRNPPPSAEEQYDFAIEIVLASLQRNYPDMTIGDVQGLVDLVSLDEAQGKVFNQSGMQRVTPGELTPRG